MYAAIGQLLLLVPITDVLFISTSNRILMIAVEGQDMKELTFTLQGKLLCNEMLLDLEYGDFDLKTARKLAQKLQEAKKSKEIMSNRIFFSVYGRVEKTRTGVV